MLKELVSLAETGMSNLMHLLKFHINDYCDLETTYGDSLVAKDGSMATILKYDGFRSLIGRKEFEGFANDLAHVLEPYLNNRAHSMQIVYFREQDPADEVDRFLRPCYETAERLGLDLVDLLDEKRNVMRQFCLDEQVFIVLWTRPSLLDPVEVRMSAQQRQQLALKYKIPGLARAQNFMRPISFMIDRHESYVDKVIQEILGLRGGVSKMPVHDAFCEMKRYLYPQTPRNWKPTLVGDPIIARWKNNKSKTDYSELAAPSLDDQFFISPGVNGRKGDATLSDTKACRFGSRIYAPVLMKIPPRRPKSFTHLFNALNQAYTVDGEGNKKQIPWSISFNLEGDGLKGIWLRKLFAGILGLTSESNRNLMAAVRTLERYKAEGEGTVVKMQVSAVTWAPFGNESELMLRRTKLSRALAGWGDVTVEEEPGDAVEAVCSCVPGLRTGSPAPESAPPLPDVTYMLPLSRPASPFTRGQTLFRTLDGKLMPWEIFSDQQSTWLTIAFGGPGSGKSVLANRLNEEMCLLGGLVRLPYICVIDIGISSSGFVSLIQEALPDDKKQLALYARIQNTKAYAMNQFDTQLGCRYPLPREREYMKQFLVALATPPSEDKPHAFMDAFVGRVLEEAFRKCSDRDERGQPREIALNVNPWLRERIESAAIEYTESTKWWEMVDILFDKGMLREAEVAQRYAVPTLMDLMSVAAELQKDYEDAIDNGAKVFNTFKLMLEAAMQDFPLFKNVTEYDIRDSRVMALDLQDVVTGSSTPAAKKQAALMYMTALNAFMRKISICKEDLDSVNQKYRSYHGKRVDELQEDYKRLFIDEYHKTGGNPQLRESFLIYGRESRKWNLEIFVASQLPEDFDGLADLATTIIILDSGNEQTRGRIAKIFGLSETEVSALKNHVHGAVVGVGATFLAKLKTKTAELSQLFTSTVGGIELWGLSTTAEDRTLRSLLYKDIPPIETRRLLKRRFPTGSCKSYVLQQKEMTKEQTGESFVDEELEQSVIVTLAKELKSDWQRMKLAGEAI